MKKYIVIAFVTFFANNVVAQNPNIIGNWKENYHLVRDTMSNGIEEINSDPQDYQSGFKKLSSEYVSYREVRPEEEGYTFEITITKEQDVFWFANDDDDSNHKMKITYAPKTNNYVITKGSFTPSNLAIEYDIKNQKILLIEEESGLTMFEFSRK